MFWGLILKANRKYTQKIKKAFHLSQAALDVTNSSEEPVQVLLTSDNHNYILCTLRKNKVEQVALDLNFAEGDEISFTSQGNGYVHLSGYLVPQVEDELDLSTDEDGEDEGVQEEEEEEESSAKKANPGKQKRKHSAQDEDESDSDEVQNENDEGEEESDDSEEEEEVKEPKRKQFKADKNKQNGLENGGGGKDASGEKVRKDSSGSKAAEKVLQGGVKIEDIRVGNGPEAKSGKKVSVYYEGRLKSNNKLFDSCKQGAGFKFGLGRGEVIKGWDIGVIGMKVGGKRRITCPPKMAYGAKGSPPVIPPNSTLVFEVELKGVN